MSFVAYVALYAAMVCLTMPSFIELAKRFVVETSEDRPASVRTRILTAAAIFALLWLPLLVFTLLAGAYRFFKMPFEKGTDSDK